MAIKIDFLANVRDLLRGTKNVQESLEDVGDSLDDVVDEGRRGNDRLEGSFTDLARRAKRSGDDVGDGLRKGFRRAEDGAEEFKDEAKSTMRETAASIRDVEGGLDAVQEIAANAFAGFGPAGEAAGLAAAIGIGFLTAELTNQQEKAEELKTALADVWRGAAEEGRNYLDDAQIIAGVMDIMFNPEKETVYTQAKRDAETLGVTVQDVLRAQAGDQEKINLLLEAGKLRAEELRDAGGASLQNNVATAAELGKAVSRYEDLNALAAENKSRAEDALELERNMGKEERDNIARAKDADAARWQAQADRIAAAREAASKPVTIEVQVSTEEAKRRIRELTDRAYEIEVGVRYRNGKPVDP